MFVSTTSTDYTGNEYTAAHFYATYVESERGDDKWYNAMSVKNKGNSVWLNAEMFCDSPHS